MRETALEVLNKFKNEKEEVGKHPYYRVVLRHVFDILEEHGDILTTTKEALDVVLNPM